MKVRFFVFPLDIELAAINFHKSKLTFTDCPHTFAESLHGFIDSLTIEGAISEAEKTSLVQPEGSSGNDCDAMFPHKPFDDLHRAQVGPKFHQEVERAFGAGNRAKISEFSKPPQH